MSTVFISGSIKIKSLDEKVTSRLDNIITSGLKVLIGDAGGVDKAVQQYLLKKNYNAVTVYCTGDSPRNNEGAWPVIHVDPPVKTKSRAYFTAKDLKMADDSDFGLMVWDCKSTGTLSNIIEHLKKKKKSVVYVSPKKAFLNIGSIAELQQLILLMDYDSLTEADKKISLHKKISLISDDPISTQPTIEADRLRIKIREHEDAIAQHQKSIAELQAMIEKLHEPIKDMFAN